MMAACGVERVQLDLLMPSHGWLPFPAEVVFGAPQFLFSLNLNSVNAAYDTRQDGQQILTNEMPTTNREQVGARLIQNWPALLKR